MNKHKEMTGKAAGKAAGQEPRSDQAARQRLAGENPQEYRSCLRKKRYTSSVEAKKAASQGARRKDAPQLYVYQCPYCGGWHLTHRKPKG